MDVTSVQRNTLARNLRGFMAHTNCSLKGLSKITGLSSNTLSKFSKFPQRYGRLQKVAVKGLAKGLGQPLETLIGRPIKWNGNAEAAIGKLGLQQKKTAQKKKLPDTFSVKLPNGSVISVERGIHVAVFGKSVVHLSAPATH